MAAARKPDQDVTPELEMVDVRFPERAYGIAAGEVYRVTRQRADELVASGLAEVAEPAQE